MVTYIFNGVQIGSGSEIDVNVISFSQRAGGTADDRTLRGPAIGRLQVNRNTIIEYRIRESVNFEY